ncbi:hypothetical protein [Frankia sp. ACN1ag]|uniref:hypothetical protein n=1 Tax=Frankia sp. ACN1ag TaxID=102891 RepID=UPI0006DC56EB|nr:hypothetical protein [Frankia sp. ACN1ag]KQC35042.1 hypothetical protein UK82_28705 [Frankia sp. ACN1ag]
MSSTNPTPPPVLEQPGVALTPGDPRPIRIHHLDADTATQLAAAAPRVHLDQASQDAAGSRPT